MRSLKLLQELNQASPLGFRLAFGEWFTSLRVMLDDKDDTSEEPATDSRKGDVLSKIRGRAGEHTQRHIVKDNGLLHAQLFVYPSGRTVCKISKDRDHAIVV